MPISLLMPIIKRITRSLKRRPAVSPQVRREQEMMTMRETDQWMCEYYKGVRA